MNETQWPVEEIVNISPSSLTEAQILDHTKIVKEEGFKCFSDRTGLMNTRARPCAQTFINAGGRSGDLTLSTHEIKLRPETGFLGVEKVELTAYLCAHACARLDVAVSDVD